MGLLISQVLPFLKARWRYLALWNQVVRFQSSIFNSETSIFVHFFVLFFVKGFRFFLLKLLSNGLFEFVTPVILSLHKVFLIYFLLPSFLEAFSSFQFLLFVQLILICLKFMIILNPII